MPNEETLKELQAKIRQEKLAQIKYHLNQANIILADLVDDKNQLKKIS